MTGVYIYIHASVCYQLQIFNKVMRHIYTCNPTGVTEKKKMENMAAVLFKKATKVMGYSYNEYDAAQN